MTPRSDAAREGLRYEGARVVRLWRDGGRSRGHELRCEAKEVTLLFLPEGRGSVHTRRPDGCAHDGAVYCSRVLRALMIDMRCGRMAASDVCSQRKVRLRFAPPYLNSMIAVEKRKQRSSVMADVRTCAEHEVHGEGGSSDSKGRFGGFGDARSR